MTVNQRGNFVRHPGPISEDDIMTAAKMTAPTTLVMGDEGRVGC